MRLNKLIALAAATFIGGAASAATVSSTGAFLELNPVPASITNGSPTSNTNILFFDELQNFKLTSALTTDSGVIAAGTRVDSHMFFLNRDKSSKKKISLQGTLTFATDILGTFSDVNGGLLTASDFLGAPTTYTNFKNRGLEGNDTVTYAGNTVSASFLNVTQPGDWVRVVTVAAVPVPAALPLLLAGLGGLGFMARRKNRKAA